jgi:hypothetical protein
MDHLEAKMNVICSRRAIRPGGYEYVIDPDTWEKARTFASVFGIDYDPRLWIRFPGQILLLACRRCVFALTMGTCFHQKALRDAVHAPLRGGVDSCRFQASPFESMYSVCPGGATKMRQ